MIDGRWVKAVALTLVASAVCVLLGFWQLDRRETKQAKIAVVEGNWDAPPLALDEALGVTGEPFRDVDEYRPATVTGTYDEGATLLVRNRPLDGTYGYFVLVPLVLTGEDTGRTLVVNRGWIPSGASGRAPDSVPASPSGTVDAIVRLRAPEPGDGRDAPQGQVQRIELAGSVSAAVSAEEPDGVPGLVTRAYGLLASEEPRPQTSPVLLPRPDADPGPHLGYSIQWFVFAAGMWALLTVHVRRTRGEERAVASGLPSPSLAAGGRHRTRRRVDEDAEDALLDAVERQR